MLRNTSLASPIAITLLVLTACATGGRTASDATGRVQDSVLSNQNAAPAVLTPPSYDDAHASTVDQLHMGSQADYHFTLGESLSFDGQSEKAIEEFKMTLVYDPSSVSVRLRLAAEFVRGGQVSEAIEQGEMVVQANPDNSDARLFLGGLYVGMKMYDEALVQFRAVLAREPEHSEAAIYLGAILAEKKEYDEALKHLQGLVANPKFLDKDKAEFYIGKIQVERGPEHYPAAEQAFLKAIQYKPENPDVVLALGLLYKLLDKEDKMVRVWKTYEDKYGPDHAIARSLGHYYLENEEYDLAVEQLEALEGYEKDNLNIKIQIALIWIQQKKYDKAAGELEEMVEQAPELDRARYYLAAVYEELQRNKDAVAQYLKIPHTSTYYTDSVIHAAHLIKDGGDPNRALEVVKAGLQKRDDTPSSMPITRRYWMIKRSIRTL